MIYLENLEVIIEKLVLTILKRRKKTRSLEYIGSVGAGERVEGERGRRKRSRENV